MDMDDLESCVVLPSLHGIGELASHTVTTTGGGGGFQDPRGGLCRLHRLCQYAAVHRGNSHGMQGGGGSKTPRPIFNSVSIGASQQPTLVLPSCTTSLRFASNILAHLCELAMVHRPVLDGVALEQV